ncbi:MAG TPA: hypothetical protein VHP59_09360, partial [Vineibacter terrae]|nr:hypothetical protein [Vineibacter terrae]
QCMPVPPDMRVTELPPPPPPPPEPAPPDPAIGLKGDLDTARDEEGRLKVTLAALRDELNKRYVQCKAPEPPKPPPEPPKPPVVEKKPEPKPAPKPEPKVAEKKPEPPSDGRMRMPATPSNDYSFLKGCWRTDFFKHSPSHVGGTSTYCFDADGRGTLTFRRSTGETCRAPATARFSGSTLRIVDSDTRCSDGSRWFADYLDCRSQPDNVARCSGQSQMNRWSVNLHRVN